MYFIYVFYVYLKLLSPKEAKVRESGRGRERGKEEISLTRGPCVPAPCEVSPFSPEGPGL